MRKFIISLINYIRILALLNLIKWGNKSLVNNSTYAAKEQNILNGIKAGSVIGFFLIILTISIPVSVQDADVRF